MLREQGTPSDVGTADVTSVHEVALIGLTPAGTTLTMPSVEAAPEPAPAAGEPRTSAAGTRPDPVAWLIALAAFAAYTTLSVAKYLRLDPGSWDLGIYTQYVRQLADLHAPVVAIRGPGFNLLGDHFQPIVALVAPFFRLFPTPVTLLVVQALLTAVSVVPVCRAARALLGTGVSRVIGVAYGFSWGLQQMIIFDFHEIAFAVPLLACSLSALVRRRPRAAAAWALPLVFVKEDQGLTVAAIGLIMIALAAGAGVRRWRERRAGPAVAGPAVASAGRGDSTGSGDGDGAGAGAWAAAGAVLVVWGLGWSALAIAVIIPHFNPAHHYMYWSDGGVISPGGGHISAGGLLAQLTTAGPVKLGTTVLVLLPAVFLALRSPLAAVAVPGLALRFLSTNSNFWGTQWHYSATLMPIAFVAAIDGLARVEARAARRQARAASVSCPGSAARPAYPPWSKAWTAKQEALAARSQAWAAGTGPAGAAGTGVAGAAGTGLPGAAAPAHPASRPGGRVTRYTVVAMAAIAALLALMFPLAGLWNPGTYRVTPHVRAEREALALIPPGTTVESTLTVLAPLAARDSATWIGTAGNPVPRYVVFDAVNSGYAQPPTDVPAFINQRYPGVTYQTIFHSDGVYVFRRTANGEGPR
ncbi:MAG TPA: DUF2079 domain-containing protein [Streptosporangiaceae bacterium]|nr:DUF2079 domain-containing protein [Streptosporangiaceae bacterium]